MQDADYAARIDAVKQRAHGRWSEVLAAAGIEERILRHRNGPCPSCGGTDRFQYTDKFGEGNYHCRQCGPGGGFKLLQAVRGVDFHAALCEVPGACVIRIDQAVECARLLVGGYLLLAPLGDPAIGRYRVQGEEVASRAGRTQLREPGDVHLTLDRRSGTLRVLWLPADHVEAVARELPAADLLHYAGHGRFAGREGWGSSLPLARGGRLSIGDILALASVPSRVVLSGCDAAREGEEASAESLGLAQAFVVAGATFAIAPVRPVSDALAARMSEALYGALAAPGPFAIELRKDKAAPAALVAQVTIILLIAAVKFQQLRIGFTQPTSDGIAQTFTQRATQSATATLQCFDWRKHFVHQ